MHSYEMSDGRWQSYCEDSSGRCVMAIGMDKKHSEAMCQLSLVDREDFLSSSPRKQLRQIVNTDKDLLSLESSDAIKLIARIILEKK